jgi:large subunit ribosomal protein L15
VKEHDLRPAKGAKKDRRRVARGNAGRAGTYAGRGRKGQNARSGGTKAPYFEGGQLPFVRRLPYRRGFNNPFRVEYASVNLSTLDVLFQADAEVTARALAEAGVLRSADEPYKVLADGGISKALVVHAPRFSATAREAIVSAGGRCEDMPDDYRLPGMGRPHPR